MRSPNIIAIVLMFTACFIITDMLSINTLWTIYVIPMMYLLNKRPSILIASVGMTVVSAIKLWSYYFYDAYDGTSIYAVSINIAINWVIVICFARITIRNHNFRKELEDLVILDPLTKIYNRRYFDQISETEIHNKYPFSMILLDIDHFKKINDDCGHEFGDRVLKKIASALQYNLREDDAAIRIGGEEFAIILPNTDLTAAVMIANRLRRVISKKSITFREGMTIPVTISLGVATLKETDTLNSLYIRTDNALYESKRNGRNRVTVEK